ncbi:hypothetical protein QC756_09120 [Sinorhizobium meliloti]|uniref:hypothetical protein n=1 Tax=Rhizobium meliloti TaxID=382 RepID=UPI000FD8FDEE|nr:hypothetical protein [Sinorhizobium meliloti]MDX0800688.1 hypothetical protein [Sinorhizobium medicae]MDX0979591.1 hypothetical protein [Sinorhizobium medicae]RVK64198.1 hypothetical protein CN154_33405 [Sinorhizobium meliloti]WGI76009.1 hypothetical protein QC756_09120 [Sinorhizobium meliloti]
MSNRFSIDDAAPPLVIPYPNLAAYRRPSQQHVDWLLDCGVPLEALIRPPMVLVARGIKAPDGCFEEDPDGEHWLVFPEATDVAYWQPKSGAMATWNKRCFAIGEDAVTNSATYAFDHCLNIFTNPIHWLRADRDGCVIIDWSQAFDRLCDCPRIAVAEGLLDKLEHHLQPLRMPEIFVLRQREAAE